MKIIIDAMGGDNAPLEIVKGALLGMEHWGVEVLLTGDTEAILRALRDCGHDTIPRGMEIVHTTETVEMCDDPSKVFRHKKDTSMGVGLTLLRDGKAEITGAVQVTVLYFPDGESGIRTLEFALPFSVQGEGKGDRLLAEPELESIETRLVNPRKISTRCRLLTRLTAGQRVRTQCCEDVEDGEGALGIEKKQETYHASAVTQILEKDFTFSDTFHISPGKEAAEELVLKRSGRPSLRPSSSAASSSSRAYLLWSFCAAAQEISITPPLESCPFPRFWRQRSRRRTPPVRRFCS